MSWTGGGGRVRKTEIQPPNTEIPVLGTGNNVSKNYKVCNPMDHISMNSE